MSPNRDDVEEAIWRALAPFNLDAYTDGVMDSLDTVIDWPDQEDEDDAD